LKSETENKIQAYVSCNKFLFDEHFRALMLVALKLHEKRVCTWNDIFEGSGLKRMGASTNTVKRAINVLIEVGMVKKERAPFPFKTRYRLIKTVPQIEVLRELITKTIDLHVYPEKYGELIEFLKEATQIFLLSMTIHFKEGKGEYIALLSFILLDFMYHLAMNMPSEIELQLLEKVQERIKEFCFIKAKPLIEHDDLLEEIAKKERKKHE